MEAIVECCAGLDVHQATMVVCLNNGPAGKRTTKEILDFGTTGVRTAGDAGLAEGGRL